jgi:poly(3-hydroxybutyrate) depolymerase
MKRTVCLYIVFLKISCSLLNATVLNDSIPPGKNFDKALFRLWYPDRLKSINGVVIMVPGSNGDGRGMVSDSLWRSFAVKNGFALLACFFTDPGNTGSFIEKYVNVSMGSGQALLDVLGKFASVSGHEELESTPMLLWGMSAGGQFNYEFACWRPERILAFVVNKGGIYYTALAPDATRVVPGILFTGEKDLEARNDIIKGLFSLNRRAGALWIFAPEPGIAHEVGQSARLACVFFNEVITSRMDFGRKTGGRAALKTLKESEGLIGDHKNHKIFPAANLAKFEYPVSWFPGKSTAEAWSCYLDKRAF